MMYTVSETAKMLGVSAATLRYYENEGLLPSVERTTGGIRLFTDQDLPWLRQLLLLKQGGMPIKELRRYVELSMQGDGTLNERLELFKEQRKAIQEQIQELQHALDLVDFNCWYYEKAVEAGHTLRLRKLTENDIPEEFREICRHLIHGNKKENNNQE